MKTDLGRSRSWVVYTRRVLGSVFVIVVVAVAAVLLRMSTYRSPGERYLLPRGFSGCVAITYDTRGASELPNEDGQYLIAVSTPGQRIVTSSPHRSGEAHQVEFIEQTPTGRRAINPGFSGWATNRAGGPVTSVVCINATAPPGWAETILKE